MTGIKKHRSDDKLTAWCLLLVNYKLLLSEGLKKYCFGNNLTS